VRKTYYRERSAGALQESELCTGRARLYARVLIYRMGKKAAALVLRRQHLPLAFKGLSMDVAQAAAGTP
jgi:hypothetical protein